MSLSDVADLSMSLSNVAEPINGDAEQAIPELLELLKIKGAIVAIDAMGCQRKICKNPVIKRRIM